MPDEDDDGLEPIETEPVWGTDLTDDSLIGIETEPEWRSGQRGRETKDA